MLKSSIINNTWKCDNCGTESQSVNNPFFHISLNVPCEPSNAYLEVDICQKCIQLTTIQPIVDYVSITVFPQA